MVATEEFAAQEMFDEFEQQQATKPLAHVRQALSMSRLRSQLARAREDLEVKDSQLAHLRGAMKESPDPPKVLAKFPNLTTMFREKEEALEIMQEQIQHLTASSDALARDLNVKETEIARLHAVVRDARQEASEHVRHAILQKTIAGVVRRWRSQAQAMAVESWQRFWREAKWVRQMEIKVITRWSHRLTFSSFSLWHAHVRLWQGQRRLLKRVVTQWTIKILSLGFSGFSSAVANAHAARRDAAQEQLRLQGLELSRAEVSLSKLREGASAEASRWHTRERVAMVWAGWKERCERRRLKFAACHVALSGQVDRIVYNMLFDWVIEEDLPAAEEFKALLRDDICQALTKKCGSGTAAASQVSIGRIDVHRCSAVIEYRNASGGICAADLAAEISSQVSNSVSRLKLRGRMTKRAVQHNLVQNVLTTVGRHSFRLSMTTLCQWRLAVDQSQIDRREEDARLRTVAAQDLCEQASQQAEVVRDRLLEQCRKSIKRILKIQLAKAWGQFRECFATLQRRHLVVSKVLMRMKHQHLSQGFARLHDFTVQEQAQRVAVSRVMHRIRHSQLCAALAAWMAHLQARQEVAKIDGLELAKQRIVEDLKESSKAMLQVEMARRAAMCKRVVQRMLSAHLVRAFDDYMIRVAESKGTK